MIAKTQTEQSKQQIEEIELPKWITDFGEKVNEFWFKPKKWESRRLYEKMGVRYVQRFLPTAKPLGKWRRKRTGENPFLKTLDVAGLEKFEKETRFNESVHILMQPLMLGVVIFLLALGSYRDAFLIFLLDLVVNLVTLPLQRYNRIRLYEAIAKMKAKSNVTPNTISV